MGARQAIGLAGELEVDAPTCGVQFHFLNAPRLLQTQCAGEQRLNANTHLAILLSKKHRPVDLWTTRIAELPTSPTGLHYDGFSLSNSTRNDEEPYIWGVVIAMASISLVQRNADVSPWFPLLLLIYPVWETLFSIYRKTVRGVSPGVADALHFHQLIYRRIVRSVFHDDESRRMLMRNNRTSPYLWGFTLLTVVPATLFWSNTPLLMAFCGLFVISYVMAYIAIVRFKVPRWLRR